MGIACERIGRRLDGSSVGMIVCVGLMRDLGEAVHALIFEGRMAKSRDVTLNIMNVDNGG